MIDIQVSGTLAAIPDNYFEERLKKVADLVWDSVKENFLQGGRPRWQPLATGEPRRLIRSGKLYGSIHKRSTQDEAEVFVRDPEPYMFAQQFGAVTHPTKTEQSKKFFWAMFAQTGDPKWKWMALSRKTQFTVRIPKSPYMVLQEEDKNAITALLGKNLFLIHEVKRASQR